MRKLTFLLFIASFNLIMLKVGAQEVITTSGDYFENATGSISISIGEPIIETFSNSNTQLTQGFQQSSWWFIGIEKGVKSAKITVFPNPTHGELNIRFPRSNEDTYQIRLISLEGKQVLSSQIKLSANQESFNISYLPSSIYYLQIFSENKLLKHIPISKIK